MTARDGFAFATGALRGHRLRSGLSLTGVAIGVASVILLTSLGEGARLYVTGEFAALGSDLLIVIPGKTETTGGPPILGGAQNDLTLEDAEALRRRLPQVRRVAPILVGTAEVRYGSYARETVIAGATPDFRGVREVRIRAGAYLPEGDETRAQRVIVLGSKLADELFGNENPLGTWVRVGDQRFRVIGVMAPRGVSLGENLDEVAHIPVASAMKLFNRTSLFRVLVQANAFEEIDSARRGVLEVLTERHDGVEDVTVLTQDAVLGAFSRILTILTAALAGIAAISLAVAGIGIMNVMLVSVSERVREIGLLKALGATPSQVLGVFLVEATVLAVAGGIAGVILGLTAGAAVRGIWPAFPVEPPGWAIAGALALSAAVGIGFGAFPARRAASLEPVEALSRH